MNTKNPVVHSDPQIMGGTPVFVGSRVSFQPLLDYLEGGDALDDFLEDFQTVAREQAITVLRQGKEAIISAAYAACDRGGTPCA
jgi:uncharacterized protein (DUF433 family)